MIEPKVIEKFMEDNGLEPYDAFDVDGEFKQCNPLYFNEDLEVRSMEFDSRDLDFFGGKECLYRLLTGKDHVISVYGKDGSNDLDNLMPTCRMCNFYKSTYSLDDFRKNLETLHERLQKTFIYRLALKYGLVVEIKKEVIFYFEAYKKI